VTSIISDSSELTANIRSISPSKIAVAYVGKDWAEFIDKNILKEIVVSPTIGSNPRAIAELVKQLGWDKVHFLDNLHAKIYVGPNSAAIGSANLSRNALGIGGLLEASVVTNDDALVSSLLALFNEYVESAGKLYLDTDAKKEKLKDLRKRHNEQGHPPSENGGNMKRNFMDYDPELDDEFYVAWYSGGVTKYNDAFASEIPDISTQEFHKDDYVKEHFSPDDEINVGYWILDWKTNESGRPSKSPKPLWIYVHHVFPNACDDEGYESVAVENPKKYKPGPPFEIDKDFVGAFSEVIMRDEFDCFRENKAGDIWLSKNCRHKFEDLIYNIKTELKEPEAAIILNNRVVRNVKIISPTKDLTNVNSIDSTFTTAAWKIKSDVQTLIGKTISVYKTKADPSIIDGVIDSIIEMPSHGKNRYQISGRYLGSGTAWEGQRSYGSAVMFDYEE